MVEFNEEFERDFIERQEKELDKKKKNLCNLEILFTPSFKPDINLNSIKIE
jgi:hypothetical protein